MTATLLERLPAGQALYKICENKTIYPGQWLSADNQQFPVFNYTEGDVLFIAPENVQLPNTFKISGERINIVDEERQLLFVADNQAIPLLFFLINDLRRQWGIKKLRARIHQILLGTESHFPFIPVPSRFLLPEIPTGTIASSQLLEDLSLPARLASEAESPGCFPGSLAAMLQQLNFEHFLQLKTTVVAIGTDQLLDCTKKLFAGVNNKQFLIKFE